jgi:hypothetical protein
MGYQGQQVGKKDTPTFAGLVITGLSGVGKYVAGVLSGSATTSDVPEGSSLYWTQARFDAAIAAIKGQISGLCELDAAQLIPITRIPPAALERFYGAVANQAARLALTAAAVQNGDTVKQTDTGELWMVIDQTQLTSNTLGWTVYTAQTASAVPFSGVTGKPTTIAGYGITDSRIRKVDSYAATISLTTANDIVLCSGSFVATLPTPVGNGGLAITVKNTGTGSITVATAAGTIDGASTYVLNDQYESAEFVSDGTNWQQF